MFSKEKIIEILNEENLFIDNFILEAFIKTWKIESIYEDANGVEYFDDMALEKIRNGINQKSQPKYEINIMDKDEITPVDMAVEVSEDIAVHEEILEVDESEEKQTQESEENSFVEEQNIQIIEAEEFQESTAQDLPVAIKREVEAELKNVTLDISNQTLAVLAESIARKITYDVADFIKKTDFIEDAVQLGEYKKDNELLVQKIDELISDNKILIKRIDELEKENNSFVKLFGTIYVKN